MYFSYLDTTFRSVHFNIDSRLANESKDFYKDLFDKFKYSNKDRTALAKKLKDDFFENNPDFINLVIHEYSHYWQTFFYPYIYITSYLQFLALINTHAGSTSTTTR